MYQRKNFAYGKVATAPSPAASGTSLTLETGQGARFPNTSGGTYICVVKQTNLPATPDIAEVVLVTSHDPAADTFTITREQEGSSARTIEVGDEFYLSPTDGVFDQFLKLTTKGDLLGFDTDYNRVPVGTDAKVLTADSTADLGVAWKDVGAVSNVRNEVPSGTVNGSNTSFTITTAPVTGTLRVYINGVRQKVTDDYTLSGTTITFVTPPLTGDKLLVDYETNAGTYATGSADFVNNETPSGTVNGTNTSFTLANTPVSGTLHLLRDGQEIYETNDYTISGATVTMVAAPVTGSVLRANYQKTVSTAGNADLLDGKQGNEYATITGTETLTNKRLTSPKINEDVALTSTATELNITDGGNTTAKTLGTIAKARVYRNGTQTIAKDGYVKVQLNAEDYDVNNNFDSTTNYQYTAPVSGYYLINGAVTFSNHATGARIIAIGVGGTQVYNNYATANANEYFTLGVSTVINLAAGGTVQLFAYQSSGGDLGIVGGVGFTYLDITMLNN